MLIRFIESLISKAYEISLTGKLNEIEFILCPVHYNYQVRQTLIKHNCTLVSEYIVTDNKRFYEVIHLKKKFSESTNVDNPLKIISPVGDMMWDLNMKSHQQYLAETISHYQRMLLSTKDNEKVKINEIINQYSAISLKP